MMFYKVSRFRCNDLSEMESLVEALALLPSVLCFPEYRCQAPCSNRFFVSLKNISLPFLDKSQHWRNFEEQQHSILGICDGLSTQKTSLCSLIDRSWMRFFFFEQFKESSDIFNRSNIIY